MTHSSSSFRLRPLSVVILTGAGNLTSTGAANLERRTDVGVGYIATRGDAGDQRSLLRTDLSDRRSDPSIEFNNSGTVAVDAGVLNLGGDGTHTGSFNIGVDGLLAFTGESIPSRPVQVLQASPSPVPT